MLLAWLERDEAVAALLGRRVPAPGEDVRSQISAWEAKRATLMARPPYALPTPVLEPLPEILAEKGGAFQQRPDVKAIFGGFDWTVGVANLDHVLSFQRQVVLEQIEERTAAVSQDKWDELFLLCLPEARPTEQMGALMEQSGKAITFSSLNPNLRVAGHATQEINVASTPNQPGVPMKFIGFVVNLGTSFLQVVEYNGRWFVRDGYHRCYGLMQKGISRVPCVFIKARNFAETGAEQPEFLRFETLFGERPPFVKDFLDDEVSVTVQQRAVRKVVRITAEEFVVEV